MSSRDPVPATLTPPGRKAGFVALMLGVSLLAHLFIIDWARDSLALVSLLDDEEAVIQVTLHKPSLLTAKPSASGKPPLPAAATNTTEPPPPPALPASSDMPAHTGQNTASPDTVPETTTSDPPATSSDSSDVPIVAPAPPATTPSEPVTTPAASASPTEPAPIAASAPAPVLSRISLPPSAELSYDAVAIKGSSKVEGRGRVTWTQDGRQYSLSGEATVLFLSVLSYRSDGHLGEPGILPERYTEKRVGKSATNTHFHRERQTITFSASTNSYPFNGGEQDRGTVFWQLAGLARGNPDKLHAGLSFDLIIAGSRTADPWRVTVNGLERVALASGSTEAWHMRIDRSAEGMDYQLEVWISPSHDWYPVKIMYVDRKGTSLGLSLSALEKK